MYLALIVDDEPMTREYLSARLNAIDPRWQAVGTAENGEQALAFLRNTPVELVITDIRMPQMDGLRLCAAIRERDPEQLIVILSGHDEFAYSQQAIRYGVSDYLLKPIESDGVADMLASIARKLEARGILPDGRAVHSNDTAAVEYCRRCKEYIRKNLRDPISLAKIAAELCISPNYLSAVFSEHEGESYIKFITRCRMEHAAGQLRKNAGQKISTIASECGYRNVKHFYHAFKQYFGVTPGEFQANRLSPSTTGNDDMGT